jgi:hypothetical protein
MEQQQIKNKTIPLPPIQHSHIASALQVFAVFDFIGAVVGGLVIWAGGNDNGSPALGIVTFASGIVSGLILLGFSVVVQHAKESSQRLERIEIIIKTFRENQNYY